MQPQFRPPYSSDDDSDDFDGFTIYSNAEKRKRKPFYNQAANHFEFQSDLVATIKKDDIIIFMKVFKDSKLNVNDYMQCGWTLLSFACHHGSPKIVEFLLRDPHIDPNIKGSEQSPLFAIIDSEESQSVNVTKIVLLLLKKGASVNVPGPHGRTPLMMACKRGYKYIVQMIIQDAAIESIDENGETAIYYAIESNSKDIVEILFQHGADITTINSKGYTPKQVAENYGYQDIVDLFPKEEVIKTVPLEWTQESAFPELNKENEVPEYFQELYPLLYGMHVEHLLPYFAEAKITLGKFLTLTDEDLKEIGIKYSYERKRILFGLLKFHGRAFSRKTIPLVDVNKEMTTLDYYGLFASHLKQITILNATLIYLQTKDFGNIPMKSSKMNLNLIKTNFKILSLFKKELLKLSDKFTIFEKICPPKPVLYVDEIMSCQMINSSHGMLRKITKYTIVMGSIAIAARIYFK